MKKVIKIAICLICMILYVENTNAEEAYVEYNGTSYSYSDFISTVSDSKGSMYDAPTYRITFIDKSGNKLGKSVDYGNIGCALKSDGKLTCYGNYKFNLSSFSNLKTGKPNLITISDLPTTSTEWKTKLTTLNNGKLNDFTLTLIKNAGIYDIYREKMIEEDLYAVVERVFYITTLRYEKKVETKTSSEIGIPCTALGDAQERADCEVGKPVFKTTKLTPIKFVYIGTGSEIATVIEWIHSNYGNTVDGYLIGDNSVDNIRYTKIFGTSFYLTDSDISTIKSGGFARTIQSVSSNEFAKIGLPNTGYALNLYKIWNGKNEEECNFGNYPILGRDWNFKQNMCCPVGTSYNSSTGKCEEPTSSTTSDFVFKATTNANICESNTKSTFETISRCDEVSPRSLKGVPKVNCVYKNEAYKDGNVYCYDEVTVNTGNILNQFSVVKSGSIIPITSFPTATVTKTCYSSNAQTALSYVNNSENYDIGSIYLNAGSYDDNSYQLTPGISLPRTTSTSSGKTLWYEKYYSATNTATIGYKYAGSVLNNYIDIETYLGNNSVTNKEQIKVNTPVNITVPVSTQSGNYTSSVTMSKCGAINNIYELEKGFNLTYIQDSDCPGMCTIRRSYSTTYSRNSAASYFEAMGYSVKKSDTSYTSSSCTTSSGGEETCTPTTSWTYSLTATKDKVTLSECQADSNKKSYTFESDCQTITFKKDSKNVSDDLTCEKSYNIINELTSDPDDPSQQYSLLNKLVYRPIDLSNPFPGINGTGRTAGSNWSTADIKKYITNRQDVYTKTPLYSITLTPEVIKQIRSYNETHDYDDFTLECIGNGTSCLSTFLRTTIKNSVNTNKSTCFNITKNQAAFSNCAESRW